MAALDSRAAPQGPCQGAGLRALLARLPMPETHGPADSSPASSPAPAPALAVGQRVSLRERPAYLKTADPMPMLRPPDLIDRDEVGQVVEVRPLGMVAVRFRRGSFLLPASELQPL